MTSSLPGREVKIGSLFSGYGGLDLGVQSVYGGRVAWHSDIEPAACRILAHHNPTVPNLGDISSVTWTDAHRVDILTGGFPCQDVSLGGQRRGMTADTRTGLWFQMLRAIDSLRPSLVVAENVRGLLSARTDTSEPVEIVGPKGGRKVAHTDRALGRVLADLADVGYDAAWHGVRASDVGAPHQRFRVLITAWPADADQQGPQGSQPAARRDVLDRRAAADSADVGHERRGKSRLGWSGSADRRLAVPHPDVDEQSRERAEQPRRTAAARSRDAAPDADSDGVREQPVTEPGGGRSAVTELPVQWGAYASAVHCWERLTRPAPAPTELAPRGGQRLSPAFVEWMMGLPPGWVTGVAGISRNEQLKALGNGVVPQQAALALREMQAFTYAKEEVA